MNDYKMNHAKKHKDTQVDYITVIDHSTLKKEIKTLLEIKVDDKVTLDDVIKKLDETINNLTNNILEWNNIDSVIIIIKICDITTFYPKV